MKDELTALDRLVEQVAFGQSSAKMTSCLGLYLSPDTVYIAETKKEKDGKISVAHLIRIPLPQDAKAPAGGTLTMSTDFLADPAKVGGLIRQSMSQIRWGSKSVIVSLSHHLGLLRFFPMPPMERRFLRSAVPLEAKKYIPIPFDTLAQDFQAAPMPPDASGKPRLGVLISVTQSKNVANIRALLDSLGLTLAGLEVAPCSALRLWQAMEPPADGLPYVQVHFDGPSVRTMVADKGLPVFFRETFLGGPPTLEDKRRIDLAGCLSFAQKQLALGKLSKVRLSGSTESLGPWKEAFAEESGLPVEIQDAAKTLSIKGGDWGAFAAIGAAARATAPGEISLDMAATNRISDEERQTARDIMGLGAILALVLAGLGMVSKMQVNKLNRQIRALQMDSDVEQAVSMSPPDVDLMLKQMQQQLDQLKSLAGGDRPKLSAVLKDVVGLMPPDIWFYKITVTDPVGNTREVQTIQLNGHCRGKDAQEEQTMALGFQSALAKSERIGRLFDVQMLLNRKLDQAGDSSMTLTPEQLARQLEDRTDFTLTLKAKRG